MGILLSQRGNRTALVKRPWCRCLRTFRRGGSADGEHRASVGVSEPCGRGARRRVRRQVTPNTCGARFMIGMWCVRAKFYVDDRHVGLPQLGLDGACHDVVCTCNSLLFLWGGGGCSSLAFQSHVLLTGWCVGTHVAWRMLWKGLRAPMFCSSTSASETSPSLLRMRCWRLCERCPV